jgi:4-amino-4-deoxy-L-arabinose transferase-like glycosyltransferase
MKKSFLFILILILGFCLRAYFLVSNPQTNSDGVLYAWIGGNLADGYGYTIAEGTSLTDARAWHVPGFPVVLAIFYKFFGKGLFVSKLPSFFFGVMTIILIYIFCEKYFDRIVALIASLFFALHPQMIFFSAEVMSESMYLFFLLLFLYSVLSTKGENQQKSYLVTGLISGLCYFIRTVGILTLPVFFLYYRYSGEKKKRDEMLAFLGGFLFVTAPWWIWSRLKYGFALSAEQNTIIQMYQFEFGIYEGKTISFFSYLFGHHAPFKIFTGYLDGISKLLKATFIPKILFFDLSIGEKTFVLFSLIVIGIVLFFGVYEELIDGRIDITITLIGTFILGAWGYAWGVHIIPEKSATIFRYTLPLALIFIIYLSVGIKRVFDKSFFYKTLSLGCIFLVVTSSLFITQLNIRFTQDWSNNFYSYAVRNLPKEDPVMGSNTEKLIELSFQNAYPIGNQNFQSLIHEIDEKNIRYLIVDTSSLYNDDQFYLVNYWYRDRIPNKLKKTSGDLFPITIYKVS